MNKKIKCTITSKDEMGNTITEKIEIDKLTNYNRFVELQQYGSKLNRKGAELSVKLSYYKPEQITVNDSEIASYLCDRRKYIIKCSLYFAAVDDIIWYMYSDHGDEEFSNLVNIDLGDKHNVFTRKLSPVDVSRALADMEHVFKTESNDLSMIDDLLKCRYYFDRPFLDELDKYPRSVINLIRDMTDYSSFVDGEYVIKACRDIIQVENDYREQKKSKRAEKGAIAAGIGTTVVVYGAAAFGLFKVGQKIIKLIKH